MISTEKPPKSNCKVCEKEKSVSHPRVRSVMMAMGNGNWRRPFHCQQVVSKTLFLINKLQSLH